ncbi:uncharacterized protein AMSG_10638 [Thecamonas trahens ATCC 50062]|uniref:Exocyst complex component Sec6 n=1 Tax=Thecamonas trahens ATCC 50062 TaxID=461836 RepID=A0A0L0DS18_THETB|nr:hypothetical protein AMSG_10638 [Thecamonas trahens ATCC 50062]KNC55042.1 hypothetical protein AMSG_10638 [Thecamonas trahens ATCC 50062]|eukprot:XP_013753348.1 hypothetical protein AMSG_10638 [Thecamonas trahens ATCC 50062]
MRRMHSSVVSGERVQEEAREAARVRVAALLQEAEHVGKVGEYMTDIGHALAAVESQLVSVVTMQLNDARSAMNAAGEGRAHLNRVRKSITTASATSTATASLIHQYPLVASVSQAATNIRATLDLLDSIQSIPERVVELLDLLEDDDALIEVHTELIQLEADRDTALARAADSPAEQAQLAIHFQEVAEVRAKLLKRIRQLFGRTLELARSMPQLLVAILIIVSKEEAAAAAAGDLTAVQYFGFEAKLGRYGLLMMDALDRAAEERFMGHFGMTSTLAEVLEAGAFVIEDLEQVYDVVRPCFPPQFRVFDFWISEYHTRLYNKLEEMTLSSAAPLTAAEILVFISWVREYQADMALRLGVTSLEPQLVESFAPLMGMYLEHMASRLHEWVDNVFLADTDDRNTNAPPERDITGLNCTAAPVHLFKMVNEQIEVASGTSMGKFLWDVVVKCITALKRYQDRVAGMLVSVADGSSLWQRRDSEADGDLAFLYTLEQINNASKCMRHTATLKDKLAAMLEEPWDEELDALDELDAGFFALANQAVSVLSGLILDDLKPVMAQFFSSKGKWIEEQLMATVIATLEDYYYEDELRECIDPVFFERLAIGQEIAVVQAYVDALLASKTPVTENVAAAMLADKEALDGFFGSVLIMKQKKAARVTRVIASLAEFLVAQAGNMALWIEDLVRDNPDLDAAQLTTLNNLRPGLDKRERAIDLDAGLRYLEAFDGVPASAEFGWFSASHKQ